MTWKFLVDPEVGPWTRVRRRQRGGDPKPEAAPVLAAPAAAGAAVEAPAAEAAKGAAAPAGAVASPGALAAPAKLAAALSSAKLVLPHQLEMDMRAL